MDVIEDIKIIGSITSMILGIVAVIGLFVKPVRERIFHINAQRDGDLALLRDRITDIYYTNLPHKSLREYEFENLEKLAQAYFARGGNSFVQKIYTEMKEEWSVTKR